MIAASWCLASRLLYVKSYSNEENGDSVVSKDWPIRIDNKKLYFSEGNSVSFPKRYPKSEKGWCFDILCMRSPGVKGIYANAALCLTDPLSCQSVGFIVGVFN